MATKNKKPNNDIEVFTPITAQEGILMQENRMMLRFGNRDVMQASLSIVQSTSRMEGKDDNIGRIYNNLQQTFYDEMEIIVFAFETPRQLNREKKKNQAYNPAEKPICRSPQGLFPHKNYVGTEYKGEIIPDACADCVFMQTGECQQHYAYFLLQCDTLKKAVYRPTFKSFRVAKFLNAMLQEDAEKGEFYTYLISTTDEDDAQWWTLRVERARRIEDADFINDIVNLNREFEANRLKMIEDRTALLIPNEEG